LVGKSAPAKNCPKVECKQPLAKQAVCASIKELIEQNYSASVLNEKRVQKIEAAKQLRERKEAAARYLGSTRFRQLQKLAGKILKAKREQAFMTVKQFHELLSARLVVEKMEPIDLEEVECVLGSFDVMLSHCMWRRGNVIALESSVWRRALAKANKFAELEFVNMVHYLEGFGHHKRGPALDRYAAYHGPFDMLQDLHKHLFQRFTSDEIEKRAVAFAYKLTLQRDKHSSSSCSSSGTSSSSSGSSRSSSGSSSGSSSSSSSSSD
jgi:uncharacterized membrane protein YgcG